MSLRLTSTNVVEEKGVHRTIIRQTKMLWFRSRVLCLTNWQRHPRWCISSGVDITNIHIMIQKQLYWISSTTTSQIWVGIPPWLATTPRVSEYWANACSSEVIGVYRTYTWIRDLSRGTSVLQKNRRMCSGNSKVRWACSRLRTTARGLPRIKEC